MSFLVSPGVHVKEIDLTNVVPAVTTSIGAIAGVFEKGPVNTVTTISSEEELLKVFGKPNGNNFETWFTASSFLQYANDLKVVRAQTGGLNAVASGSAILIRDTDHYLASFSAGEASVGEWAARTAGTIGNGIGVSICATATAYEQNYAGNAGTLGVTTGTPAIGATTVGVDNGGGSGGDGGAAYSVGDIVHFQEADGQEYEVTAINTDNLTIKQLDNPNGGGLKTALSAATNVRRRWRFYDLFDGAPGTSAWATANGRGAGDELHVVVYDTTGDTTGFDVDADGNRTNAVMETFANMSKNPVAKTAQGGSNYYPDVIYRQSNFVYWMDHNSSGSNWGTDTTSAYTAVNKPTASTLASGTDDYAVTAGELQTAYDKFSDTESLDINLVMGGPSSVVADTKEGQDTHVTMITDLVEKRKDCVGFVSPYRSATVNVASNITQASNVIEAFDLCPSSSYMVYDSGYKYMYDKYNDVYRFVPLNGDTAGLCANADRVADPWFSPAGYNRGGVRGAIKLSFNPTQAERDRLYRARVNPVVNFPGQGVTLFGDKTALTRPSAFDRINVRRLFLVLEKAIATAAKFQLFEFNDEFTRAQFRNLVEPFLRDVQGRRGISDFSVVADGTNNTGEVIDRNEFIGDIFIKPARSINFITLNFVAVRTGVSFTEVGG